MSAVYINKRSEFSPPKKACIARFQGISCYQTRSESMRDSGPCLRPGGKQALGIRPAA